MEQNKDLNQIDIPLAKRIYINNSNSILFKKLLIFSPFLLLLFSYAALQLIKNIEQIPYVNLNFQAEKNQDNRILGHLPYPEIPREKLVQIENYKSNLLIKLFNVIMFFKVLKRKFS